MPLTPQQWREISERVVVREAALAAARTAVEDLRFEHPDVDVQRMLDAILSKLIGVGYTVIAPDGETQVEAPF